jgi:hypothetical protein
MGSDGNTFWMCCAPHGNNRNNDDEGKKVE